MTVSRVTRGSDGRFTGSVGSRRGQVPTAGHGAGGAPAAEPADLGAVASLYELFKSGHLEAGTPANVAAAQSADRFAGHGLDAGVVAASAQAGQVEAALDLLDRARADAAGRWDRASASRVGEALGLLGVTGVNADMRRGEVADAWTGRQA